MDRRPTQTRDRFTPSHGHHRGPILEPSKIALTLRAASSILVACDATAPNFPRNPATRVPAVTAAKSVRCPPLVPTAASTGSIAASATRCGTTVAAAPYSANTTPDISREAFLEIPFLSNAARHSAARVPVTIGAASPCRTMRVYATFDRRHVSDPSVSDVEKAQRHRVGPWRRSQCGGQEFDPPAVHQPCRP